MAAAIVRAVGVVMAANMPAMHMGMVDTGMVGMVTATVVTVAAMDMALAAVYWLD